LELSNKTTVNSASHTKRLVARRCDTQSHNRIKSVIAAVIIVAVCVLGFPTTAQQTGPQNKQGAISDDDFIALQQQIKELKNPTFRAFLTIQLLRMDSGEPGPMRRQAAVDAATQGAKDLCEHQDEMWTPNAAWLHEGFVKQIKRLQSSEETAPEICVLKTEAKSNSAGKEFSSAIKMLNDPETSAAGRDLAKSAILSGQISAGGLLGQLNSLNASHSPHLAELLSSLLSLEEKRPGTLPLQLLPFFTPLFREKSVPPEVLTRYLFVAVRASRVSARRCGSACPAGDRKSC
jgi:hypothetical protein